MKKSKAASSARAQAGALGGAFSSATAFGSSSTSTFGNGFGATPSSQLSYVYEPPELSTISDPAIVVAWKSLQKKNSATKTKALDDLLAYVTKSEDDAAVSLEEGFLDAWVKLYARTSIDNSRGVRQRAHTLQGRITRVLGKRIAKALPSLIPPWLCGLHDNDKLVVRATQEALSGTFPTEEKRLGIWKVYHGAILDYCSNAVLQESTATLSDERTTNKDDAESKFARTISSAVLTVARAIEVLEQGVVMKCFEQCKGLLDSEKLWALVDSKDPFLRQAVYRLTLVRLKRLDDSVDQASLERMSKALIGRALRKDQTGSILPFVELLAVLTAKHPEIWTSHSVSQKKSPSELLEQFLKRLPPSSSPEFWTLLKDFLSRIPMEVICPTITNGETKTSPQSLLAAFHEGLSRKDNFMTTPSFAWDVFLAFAERSSNELKAQDLRDRVGRDFLFPLIRQYVSPDSDGSAWTIGGSPDAQADISWRALSLATKLSQNGAEEFVGTVSSAVVEQMQASLPEQSQGFNESQNKVGASLSRWNLLKKTALSKSAPESLKQAIDKATQQETRAAMQLLANRNGKPFGAAMAIQSGLTHLSPLLMANAEFKHELETFLVQQGPTFIGTPSTSQILEIFRTVDRLDPSLRLYSKILSEVLEKPSSPSRTKTLSYFLRSDWPEESELSTRLLAEIQSQAEEFTKGDASRAEQLEIVLANKSSPSDLTDSILAKLVGSLSVDDIAGASLKTLSSATTQNQDAVRRFLNSSDGSVLGPKLLLLSQSKNDPELQRLATDFSTKTRMLSSGGANSEAATAALVQSIHDGLKDTSNSSLTVDVLVSIAMQVLNDAGEISASVSERLLPSDSDWHDAFDPFTTIPPSTSISITNSLGGAVHWVHRNAATATVGSTLPPHDAEGHSVPVRMATYVLSLFEKTELGHKLDKKALASMIAKLAVFREVLTDSLSVQAAVPLWVSTSSGSDQDIVSLCIQAQEMVGRKRTEESELESVVLSALLAGSKGTDVSAYYAARAYINLANELLEVNPTAIPTSEDDLLQIVRKPTGSLQEAAKFNTAYQGSGKSKVANTLIAELSRFNFVEQEEKGLYLLTLLGCLLRSFAFDDVAFNQQHRLVLFVKHITGAIRLEPTSRAIDSEIFKALVTTTPLVKEIFDNFWTDLVDKLVDSLLRSSSDSTILEPALRLSRTFRRLSTDEETNDDLKEAWTEKKPDLSEALTQLLRIHSESPDVRNQPERIVNDLIAEELDRLQHQTSDPAALYPVIATKSFVLQNAAFKILHRTIPSLQEKVTFDSALIKDYVAKLPNELLALIAEAPSEITGLANASWIPPFALQYLYAWILIYDHWTDASYQVQHDYVEAIKNGKHITGLLDLIFEIAINSRAKPLDASKISFEEFNPSIEEGPERDCQLMICHLYFLSLKRVPALVREWWRNECPRSLQKPVEECTEKYFSPSVIAAELAETAAWIPKQDKETDTPLEVKIATRAREVTAMYPIDEQMSSIRVTLPINYPLSTIAVDPVNRVGVDEKKWRAWLKSAAGVINFAPSSGGIGAVTDGLVGWRRNVTGTIKGHTECAICYSIVNADRQLPTKKCGTCKQAFHGTCLWKWFKSSGGSSCPLCRTAFNFG